VRPKLLALTEDKAGRLAAEAQNPRVDRRSAVSYPLRRFYSAVAFAAYAVAGQGEVLAVRWSDLDLKKKSARKSC
jgi:hypothetical protein